MTLQIPTTQEQKDTNQANMESKLQQEAPPVDKSFIKVLSAVEALQFTQLYKYGVERALQTLALTATGDDLDAIGNNYGVYRKPAEAAQFTLQTETTIGATIPITIDYVGDANQERYIPDVEVVATGTTTDLDVTALNAGVAGNLNTGATMTLGTPVTGVADTATITAVLNVGTERETDEAYRDRVLNRIRTITGGGNAASYREWAQEPAGVARAYPYTGAPESLIEADVIYFNATSGVYTVGSTDTGVLDFTETELKVDDLITITGSTSNDGTYRVLEINTSYILVSGPIVNEGDGDDVTISIESQPGDRTVYIEADETVDPDGIPPEALVDEARASILNDPVTGESRPPLGEIPSTLWVLPISRTTFYTEVTGLVITADNEAVVKNAIEDAVEDFFSQARPFVDGLDSELDRSDQLTDVALSGAIQDVLSAYGASASSVEFALTSGGTALTAYTLGRGELAKSGGVTYA